MDSFYIYLIAAIILGALAGYLAGFVRVIFLFLKIAGAITAASLLNPFIAEMISNYFMVMEVWSRVIAFVAVLLFSFILLQLLLMPLKKRMQHFNKAIFNKVSGVILGVTSVVLFFMLFVQLTGVLTVPPAITNEIKTQGIAEMVNRPGEIIKDRFIPVFQEQPTQVMALKTADATPDLGIVLSYTTADFGIRPELETQMLQLVNAERNKYSLKPLAADAELSNAARLHSADMFRRGYFSHSTPDGINPFQRLRKLNITYVYAGENLAMAPTLLKAHTGLMKSPGHRANILNPSYGRMGIGILDGGAHGLMITQEFRD